MPRSLIALLFTVCTVISAAHARTLDVPAEYGTIRSAVYATADGDTVLIQPGTYDESGIYVGTKILITGTAPEDSAVVLATKVGFSGSSVFRLENDAEIAGLSLEDLTDFGGGVYLGGEWNGTVRFCRFSRGHGLGQGTAVYVRVGNLLLEDCVFEDNRASGGIVYVRDEGTMTLRRCRISNNRVDSGSVYAAFGTAIVEDCVISRNNATQNGAAMHAYEGNLIVRRTRIVGNTASSGGGIYLQQHSTAVVEDSEISGNTANSDGGGIYIIGDSLTVSNSTISGNSAARGGGIRSIYFATVVMNGVDFVANVSAAEGGAFYAEDTYRLPQQFSTCRFVGNESALGGAVSIRSGDAVFTNCVVAENFSSDRGALWICEGGTTLIENCTVMYNTSDVDNSGGIVVYGQTTGNIRNTIAGDNLPSQLYYGYGATGTVTYSDVEGGWLGEGNINVDPLFRSYGPFDYLLNLGSPCIDAGDPAILDGISDWHPRWPNRYLNGPRSDMGAYGGPRNINWVR